MNFLRTNRVIILPLLVLFSFNAVGYTYDAHYCGGEMQSISFFGKAEPCEMGKKTETKVRPCCKKKQEKDGFHKKGCCSNELHHLNALQDFQSADGCTLEKVDHFNMPFILTSKLEPSILSFLVRIHQVHLDLPPPRIDKSILILHQVLRI